MYSNLDQDENNRKTTYPNLEALQISRVMFFL
jgi:hypothetical protein